MFDAEVLSREPDAIIYLGHHDRALWTLPWIAGAVIRKSKDGPADESEVRLWFQASQAIQEAESAALSKPRPDRTFDLQAYNAGHAPPEGFWRIHPGLEAFEVEYDRNDGANWWARLWLQPASVGPTP